MKLIPNFIKTKDNNIWFTINKIDDEYLCFPKFINEHKGKKYKEWYENKNNLIKKYYKKISGLDENVYLVPDNCIVEVYNPVEFIEKIVKKPLKYNYNKYVFEIVNFISTYFNIDKKYIGIEGSLLLEKYKENSDIDILIYGVENAKKVQKSFSKINNSNIRLFTNEELIKYVEKRLDSGYGKDVEHALKQFKRRFYGFVNNKQFSIVCVPLMEEDGYINLKRNIKFIDYFDDVVTITDDTYSGIVPTIYKGIDSNDIEYRIEIFNHYGINQARLQEKVHIKGKWYLDLDTKEKIIILSFWSGTEERFDVYE